MARSEPAWWYSATPRWQTAALRPLSRIYGALARRRIETAKPYQCSYPVICIGNFTAGGSGKTPAALRIADLVRTLGFKPVFLSRGYGGRLRGPVRVDPERHTAVDTGDEPLLLARSARTIVSRDRARGAQLIEATCGARTVILMDDGLQNPTLAKDVSIALVDAGRGLGNGEVIPAGPLRAPLFVQQKLVHAVLITGAGGAFGPQSVRTALRGFDGDVVTGHVEPVDNTVHGGRRYVAYAGIANPQRFFSLLRSLGATLLEAKEFADHHAFTETDANQLLATADRLGASLITTAKDAVRLSGATAARGDLMRRSSVLDIQLKFDADSEARLSRLIAAKIAR